MNVAQTKVADLTKQRDALVEESNVKIAGINSLQAQFNNVQCEIIKLNGMIEAYQEMADAATADAPKRAVRPK